MDKLKEQMQKNNFFVGKINPAWLSSNLDQDIKVINQEFDELPRDGYAPKSGRHRRMVTGYIDLRTNKVVYHNGIEKDGIRCFSYNQGLFNPEIKNIRYFESVTEDFKNIQFIPELLLTDLEICGYKHKAKEEIILFEVQLIKFIVDQNQKIAKCSPEVIHQDGNKYAFAHLVKRENIDDAFNCIGNIKCVNKHYKDADKSDILAEFTIYDFMESYGCDDEALSHYVSDICLSKGAENGTRSIMTIAFFDSVNSFEKICPGIHTYSDRV